MDTTGRQIILLVSLLLLLAVVMLFLFVYAPNPLQPATYSFKLPGPLQWMMDSLAELARAVAKGLEIIF